MTGTKNTPQPAGQQAPPAMPGDSHRGPAIISSANGLRATTKAMEMAKAGTTLIEALVAGVKIVENDPADMSVGYGGLPNEEGIVELDASVMDGRIHRAGSVGALRNIKNPAAVALEVLRRTDHVMIVGEGALRFARAVGFKEENLLTEEARLEWLKWKGNLGHEDDWLNDDERQQELLHDWEKKRADAASRGITLPDLPMQAPRSRPSAYKTTTGTIHCSGLSPDGTIAAVTSTSGLSYKIPGRLGDSPIIGAGMYCDGNIGSAGATGRGEAVMQVCGAFSIVQHMEAGLSPTEACRAVAQRIADRTHEKRLLDSSGRPNFDVKLYAVRKDGAYGCCSLHSGAQFAISDTKGHRLETAAFLFEKK
ncbi:MAG: N(4)-(beta-N-acetylglucosaminyl)-L-asparaginase [Phycisphaerales bacterium]|nr:N(4)-(beta-N-acetylglucosaminyl)-L-asparaginase [Phycisphaerales bacterium]